jgi:hypothetical protein
MTEPKQQTIQNIIDKYSPITRGRTGLLGLAFKAVAKPVEIAANTLGAASQWVYPSGYTNSAGQVLVNASATVAATYRRMEEKLQQSFNRAGAKTATPDMRDAFLVLADEVKNDAAVLAPAGEVLRSAFDLVTEPYKFMVSKETTLAQGIAQVTAAQERKNPVTIRRHPLPVPQPEAAKKAVGL